MVGCSRFEVSMEHTSILHEFANNVLHNLFKPLLLSFIWDS